MNGVDVLIIGGGPAGYHLALLLAKQGKSVCVVEKKALGGVCLNEGCVPSKTLLDFAFDLEKVQKGWGNCVQVQGVEIDVVKWQIHKNQIIQKLNKGIAALFKQNKVQSMVGEAKIVGKNQHWQIAVHDQILSAEHLVVATGSSPKNLPILPVDHRNIWDNADALNFQTLPKTLLVVGAGAIGLELGSAFRALGSSVLVLEAQPNLLPALHPSFQPFLKRALAKLPIAVDAQIVQVENQAQGVQVRYTTQGQLAEFWAEKVIVSVGRKPNVDNLGLENVGISPDENGFLHSKAADNFWAIGDVSCAPMLAHKALMQAQQVFCAILNGGEEPPLETLLIPQVIYTHPEIAFFGQTSPFVHKTYFQSNARALANNQAEGMMQIFSDENQTIVGAQIVGACASELIYPLLLASKNKIKVHALKEMVPAHPSFAESIMAALGGM